MRVGDIVTVKETGRRALITGVLAEDHYQVQYLPDLAEDPVDSDSGSSDEGGIYTADDLQVLTS